MGERAYRVFGGAIQAQHFVGFVTGDAACVDDFAHALLFFHLFGGGLRAENHALDVDAQHPVDFIFVQAQECADRFYARVVDKHVHPPEGLDCLVH